MSWLVWIVIVVQWFHHAQGQCSYGINRFADSYPFGFDTCASKYNSTTHDYSSYYYTCNSDHSEVLLYSYNNANCSGDTWDAAYTIGISFIVIGVTFMIASMIYTRVVWARKQYGDYMPETGKKYKNWDKTDYRHILVVLCLPKVLLDARMKKRYYTTVFLLFYQHIVNSVFNVCVVFIGGVSLMLPMFILIVNNEIYFCLSCFNVFIIFVC